MNSNWLARVSSSLLVLGAVMAGCGGSDGPKLDAAADGPRALQIDPASHAYGTVPAGTASPVKSFTIRNGGTAATGTLTAAVSGPNASEFTLSMNTCTTILAPNATCTVAVTFSPTNAGAKTAMLTVSGTPGRSVSAMLTGTGGAAASLSITPMSQPFGSVATGASGMPASFTVTNTGGAATGKLAATLGGADASDFTIATNGCSEVLAPMATCKVDVVFGPKSMGNKSATLSVTGTPGGTINATLTGTGVAPGSLSISPNPQRFADTVANTKSASTTFTITNGGGVPTGALMASLDGANATEFTIVTDNCKAALPAAMTCTVVVQFSPTTAGDKTANLTVVGMPGGTGTAGLSGRALAPARLVVTPSTQSFGSVVTGATSTNLTFTFTNSGGVTSGDVTAALGGVDANQFSIVTNACNGQTLAPSATCTVIVAFSPTSTGAKSASLTLTGAPGGAAVAMLSGTGQNPGTLVATPSVQAFGAVGVGASSISQTITIMNTGGAATGPIATALGGADPTQFPLVPNGNGCAGAPLAAGQSCTIGVTFTPTTIGMKTATLNISASPGGMLAVALSGNAVAAAALTFMPTAQDFGSVGTGSSSPDVTFKVTNTGGAASGTLAASLAGTNSDQFTIVNNGCMAALMAAGSCDIIVKFNPTSMGAKSAQLNVTGTPGGTSSAPLTGTGVAPSALQIAPSTQSFGQVLVGQSSADVTYTLTNNGAAATGVLTPTFTGANAMEFSISDNMCTTLAQAASCTFKVKMSPTAIGAKVATLTVTGAAGAMVTAALTGSGVGLLSIDPETEDFGNAGLGITDGPTETFTVRNNNPAMGAATGAITTTLLAGTPAQFAIVTDTCNGTSVAAQGSCTITIRFTPAGALGAKMGTLTVAGTAGGMASAALAGTAVSALTVSPSPLDFSATVIGTFAQQTLVVGNAGTAPTTGTVTTALAGTDLSQFSVASDACAGTTLAGGATCNIVVRFIPSATGAKTATVSVNAGAGNSGQATLTGTGTPAAALAVMPGTIAFGDVYAASSSMDQTVTVTNSTMGSATGAMTFGVTGAGFSISGGTCTSGVTALTGGTSCTILVKFSPAAGTAAGDKTGTVNVSASPGGSVTTSLTAKVLTQLSVTPTTKVFGNVVVGQQSAEQLFVVKNESPTMIAGTLTATLAGTNAGDFTIPNGTNTCTAALAPAASCNIGVKFAPTTTGNKTADLAITGTNVAVTATPLTGTGIQDADLEVTSTADIGYGTVAVGATSGTRTVTVINNGGVISGAISHTMAGTNPTDFIVAGGGTCVTGTTTLAPGATCTYVLNFKPTAAGGRSATFVVAAAASTPGGSTTAINLGGTGVSDGLSVSPTPSDFGAVTAGQSSGNITFTVKNNSGSTASGALSLATTGQFAVASGGTCTAGVTTLAAGATCTVLVTFSPTGAPGDRSGTLDVTGAPGGTGTAALYGRSRADATLVVTPAGSYDFGQVTVGQSSPEYTVTVRNDGDVTSGTISATLAGANPTVFAISTSTCTTLAAGATCTVKVRYNPASAGTNNTADLNISATPGGVNVVPLAGTAVSAAALAISPAANAFGSQAVLSESAAADFTVSNAAGALTTGTLSYTLSNTTDFRTDSSACPATLAGGASCIVKVYFKPTTIAAITGKLTVAGSPGGSVEADLTGTGVSALTVDAQTFGDTMVGAASADVSFTVTNAGTAPTTGILSTVVTGTDAAQFSVTEDACAGTTLAGGASCIVKVRFVPSSAGAKTATVTVSGTPGNAAAAALAATAN